jgi:hypothetical protein
VDEVIKGGGLRREVDDVSYSYEWPTVEEERVTLKEVVTLLRGAGPEIGETVK